MSQPAVLHAPAGFWKRYVAYSIDVVIVGIVLDLFSGLFLSVPAGQMQQLKAILAALQNQQELSQAQTALLTQAVGTLSHLLVVSSVAYMVMAGAYFAFFESSAWQATPGKRMVGIRVTDGEGRRIGRGRAFARFFAAGLSWITLNIGHALAAIPPQQRALHDYLADTRVENSDPDRPGSRAGRDAAAESRR
jgi:uncharacterized RDD family membrane protein YckC